MKITFKILSLLLPILFFTMSALAIDINEIENFSSRSTIMSTSKNTLTQEQKDLLISM
jgi:hypothetical protein